VLRGAFLGALAEAGYDGHAAIEVEDRASERSLRKRLDSTVLSRRYLLQSMIG
jgi:sugar phosphate isomerase/epimerase